MDKERLGYLHNQYLSKSISSEEWKEFQALLADTDSFENLGERLDENWTKIAEEQISVLDNNRFEKVYENIIQQRQPRSRVLKLWTRIAVAASLILVTSAGLFYLNQKPKPEEAAQKLAHDVAPGKQGATLTLGNGRKIRLTDAANGQLAKESGVVITKSSKGQLVYEIKEANAESNKINTLSTSNGETYQVKLPDGSSVWLNAASTIKYPASFARLSERRIELSGEAYFEISKDKAHPFIVKTAQQEVTVLGTHFNVNSYTDEPVTATTLLEGSVKITTTSKSKTIKPGEQAINDGSDIHVGQANIENITDWKDGDFNFDHVNFKMAMRKIARWYDVEIIYDHSVPDDIESGGWISRNNQLSAVLKSIELTGFVHFKVEGKKIYVSR